MSIDDRLHELGLEVPDAKTPLGNYVPALQVGKLAFVAGHLSDTSGKLGADLDTEAGYRAAREAAIKVLGTLRTNFGLDSIEHIVRVGGLVNATSDFVDHAAVVNGASDLLVEVFGEAGKHARASFGVASLPKGAAVEIELIAQLK